MRENKVLPPRRELAAEPSLSLELTAEDTSEENAPEVGVKLCETAVDEETGGMQITWQLSSFAPANTLRESHLITEVKTEGHLRIALLDL